MDVDVNGIDINRYMIREGDERSLKSFCLSSREFLRILFFSLIKGEIKGGSEGWE